MWRQRPEACRWSQICAAQRGCGSLQVYRLPHYFRDDWLNEYCDSRQAHKERDAGCRRQADIIASDYRFVYLGPEASHGGHRALSWRQRNAQPGLNVWAAVHAIKNAEDHGFPVPGCLLSHCSVSIYLLSHCRAWHALSVSECSPFLASMCCHVCTFRITLHSVYLCAATFARFLSHRTVSIYVLPRLHISYQTVQCRSMYCHVCTFPITSYSVYLCAATFARFLSHCEVSTYVLSHCTARALPCV
jgi:hypothetical protein